MNENPNMKKNELLDIFSSDEDKNGNDLLKMSNFLSIFIEKLKTEISTGDTWDIQNSISNYFGEIAEAIKLGVDISQMGMLIADSSHFSQTIIDGLKKGIYHIGMSKEVAGNYRPAILDDKEQLVKFFTLKKAFNPSSVLADISSLSMQASLQRISIQLKEISQSIKTIIEFNRRESFTVPFLNARDSIIQASHSENNTDYYLDEADRYLKEGLNSLYTAIEAQIHALNIEVQKHALTPSKRKIELIDKLLNLINEDMQMIFQYVGLRIYLSNYRGKNGDAASVLDRFRSFMQKHAETKEDNGQLTAFELIHEYYPFCNDFWIEKPQEMIKALTSSKKALDQKNMEIYYIDAEEVDDGQE
ncbi:MAG: hypothetical protein IK130_11965 [Oscillospiraceae bacterium]|nr:hypothetical protein [Oscillospiraceae bacterium]